MMNQLPRVAALLFFTVSLYNISLSQINGPEFLDCHQDSVYLLCDSADGVRLPDNNKFYLGENHPEATSCSVHLSGKMKVSTQCGPNLEYEVLLFLNDSSQGIVLQPPTIISADSLGEIELIFDSALSPQSEIQQDGIPYSSCQPYRLKWIVRDSCDNESICEEKFELYDCNTPTFSLTDSFYIIHLNFTWDVPISVDTIIINLMDDCSDSNEFLFSVHEHIYQADSMLAACDVPAFGVAVPWIFWIADKGRDLNCDGTITWAERQKLRHQFNIIFLEPGVLDCDDSRVLSGNIKTPLDAPVANAEVSIYSQEVLIASQITGLDGEYYFGPESNLPENYVIKVGRNDNHRNGVSTPDIIVLMKHLLGIKTIDDPYKLIAAEVNNSIHLSAIDLIEIRKLILGIYSVFPHSPSWKFVPADYVLNMENPFSYPKEVTVEGKPTWYQDFIGVKTGDLNNTVTPN